MLTDVPRQTREGSIVTKDTGIKDIRYFRVSSLRGRYDRGNDKGFT